MYRSRFLYKWFIHLGIWQNKEQVSLSLPSRNPERVSGECPSILFPDRPLGPGGTDDWELMSLITVIRVYRRRSKNWMSVRRQGPKSFKSSLNWYFLCWLSKYFSVVSQGSPSPRNETPQLSWCKGENEAGTVVWCHIFMYEMCVCLGFVFGNFMKILIVCKRVIVVTLYTFVYNII